MGASHPSQGANSRKQVDEPIMQKHRSVHENDFQKEKMKRNWPLIIAILLALLTIALLLLGYGWASMAPLGIAIAGVILWLLRADFKPLD